MATYKIAVLGGDGIGQEVTPQAQQGARTWSARPPAPRSSSRPALVGGVAIDATGGPLPASDAPPLPAEPRHPVRLRGRAQVGQPAPGAAPRARAPRPAQGARPLRQPAPGHVLPDAGGRLAAQALGGRGHGHHGDPGAHGRALLRRAAGARGVRRRRRARGQHHGLHLAGDRARGAGRVRRGDEAEEAAGLGGQGQRARRLAALAGGGDAGGEGLSRRCSSSTCSWTTAPWPSCTSRPTSTRSWPRTPSATSSPTRRPSSPAPWACCPRRASAARSALYEPVHGTAPDIAGQGGRQSDRGDPVGGHAAALLARSRARTRTRVDAAVLQVLEQGHRTRDIHAEGMKAGRHRGDGRPDRGRKSRRSYLTERRRRRWRRA